MTISADRPAPPFDRTSHLLGVFDGRLLDGPAIARSSDAWVPTVYNSEGLIVSAPDQAIGAEVGTALTEILAHHSCRPDGPSWLGGESQGEEIPSGPGVLASGVRIVSSQDSGAEPAMVPDPWSIIEELRARLGPDTTASVGLNHLMTSAEQIGGNPLAIGHGRVGLDSYGITGSGGHGPVSLMFQPMRRSATGRRPRVVVLDTGIGDHPWFRSDPAETTVTFKNGRTVGPDVARGPHHPIAPDGPDVAIDPLLGSLPTHTGHGTFIAGLLRQSCPDADIVALTIMQANGVVPEHKLIRALSMLRRRQTEEPGWADVILLSLGYYAETGEDVRYTSGLKHILLDLGRLGVAVFAAAGNDATSRPSYPAAFAVDPDFGAPDVLPIVSVAALGPGGTLAPFSNNGTWVTAEAPGVNVVSASPTLPDGSAQPTRAFLGPGNRLRSSLDQDDYREFAVWSGTSFAAPVLAGKYLQALIDNGFPESIGERRRLLPIGHRGLNPQAWRRT